MVCKRIHGSPRLYSAGCRQDPLQLAEVTDTQCKQRCCFCFGSVQQHDPAGSHDCFQWCYSAKLATGNPGQSQDCFMYPQLSLGTTKPFALQCGPWASRPGEPRVLAGNTESRHPFPHDILTLHLPANKTPGSDAHERPRSPA